MLSQAPLLLGTDGTKMSKSRGNAITIGATADETAGLIKGAKTDAVTEAVNERFAPVRARRAALTHAVLTLLNPRGDSSVLRGAR